MTEDFQNLLHFRVASEDGGKLVLPGQQIEIGGAVQIIAFRQQAPADHELLNQLVTGFRQFHLPLFLIDGVMSRLALGFQAQGRMTSYGVP